MTQQAPNLTESTAVVSTAKPACEFGPPLEESTTVAPKRSLRSLAMRGTAWAVLGFGSGQLLRLGANLILTRLLFPEAFGLMALVNVFLQGLQMLSDMGINASIIQNKLGDEPTFLRTAWTLQIIRGGILYAGACAIAWPVAQFYDEPQLAAMILVAGLTVFIVGFQTTALPQHNRNMQLGRITVVQLLAQVINLSVTLILAWKMRSVWALVWGAVSGAVVQVVIGHLLLPGVRHRFEIDRACMWQIVHFGKWLFLASGLGFLGSQASDKLVLGKLVDVGQLGVYSIAFMLAMLPQALIGRLMSTVLYPALSAAHREQNGQLEARIKNAREVCNRGLLLILTVLAMTAPLFFKTLYDPRYWEAGWMVQLLCIHIWFIGLNGSLNAALLAIGDSRASAFQNITMIALSIPAMIAGYYLAGLTGVILGLAAGTTAAHLVLHALLARRGVNLLAPDLKAHMVAALLAGLIYQLSQPTGLTGSIDQLSAMALSIGVAVSLGLAGGLIHAFRTLRT